MINAILSIILIAAVMALMVWAFITGMEREADRLEQERARMSQLAECELAEVQGWPLDCNDFKG